MGIPDWVVPTLALVVAFFLFVLLPLMRALKNKPKTFDAKSFVESMGDEERDELLGTLALMTGESSLPSPSEARRRMRAEWIRASLLGELGQSDSLRVGSSQKDPWLHFVLVLNNGVNAAEIAENLQVIVDVFAERLPRNDLEPIYLSEEYSQGRLTHAQTDRTAELVRDLMAEGVRLGRTLAHEYPGKWSNADFTIAICATNGAIVWDIDPLRDAARFNPTNKPH